MTFDPQKPNDESQPRFGQELIQQPERADGPVSGEAQPIPQPGRGMQLRLPLSQARAIWVLLGLNIAIFVIPTVLQFVGVKLFGFPINDAILNLGAKDNQSIRDGEYYRLLTSMFLHLGILHIGVNAYSLYAIGPETERIYGTPRFLAIYFLSGISGGIASYALSSAPGVGASGAIFGLVGALAVFFYMSRELLGNAARQQFRSLLTVIMINLFIGFGASGVIDNFAHLGGLAGGAILGWLLAPRFAVDERLYPPQVVRRGLSWGWAGAIGFLALMVLLVITIPPAT